MNTERKGELLALLNSQLEGIFPVLALWPVAIDAWDLLTEPELAQVRQCPVDAGGCGWLFLDTSRAGNRRWCDMRTCGNRAKVRAHYSRTARA